MKNEANKNPEIYKKIYMFLRIISIILFVTSMPIGNITNNSLGGFLLIAAIVCLVFSIKFHKNYNQLAGIVYTQEETKKNKRNNIITTIAVIFLMCITVNIGDKKDSDEYSQNHVNIIENGETTTKDKIKFATGAATTTEAATTEAPTTTQAPTTTEAPATTEAATTTEAPTTTQTPTTTQAPTTTQTPTTTQASATTQAPEPVSIDSNDSVMVWIVSTGKKYHRISSCSNMKNPYQVSIEEAISTGRDACKKCY